MPPNPSYPNNLYLISQIDEFLKALGTLIKSYLPTLKVINATIKAAMFETETKCSESGINVSFD